jgi:orotidine-5'-phosphate decarboxylase
MPTTPFLVPGYGAQGATAADCAKGFLPGGTGAIVNSSRALTFAFRSGSHAERFGEKRWRDSVAAAVYEMGDALAAATGAPRAA